MVQSKKPNLKNYLLKLARQCSVSTVLNLFAVIQNIPSVLAFFFVCWNNKRRVERRTVITTTTTEIAAELTTMTTTTRKKIVKGRTSTNVNLKEKDKKGYTSLLATLCLTRTRQQQIFKGFLFCVFAGGSCLFPFLAIQDGSFLTLGSQEVEVRSTEKNRDVCEKKGLELVPQTFVLRPIKSHA